MAYSKNRRLAEIVSDTSGNLSVEGLVVPTQSSSDNDTSAASTAFVHAHIDAVLDSAPGTLNTLNEIAAALNDDGNFNTTVTNAIAAKLPLAGGTLTGNLTVPYLATTSYIDLNNSGNRGKIGWSGNHTYIATTSSVGSIIFKNNVGSTASPQTGGDTLLTLTDGGNATFPGTITSAGLSSSSSNTGTNPAANGHIASELQFYNGSATDNNLNGIGFYNSNSAVDARIAGVHRSHSSRHGEIAFLMHDGSALTERVRFNKDGNVGIGETNPNSPLHVKTTDQSIQVRNTGNANVGLEIYRDSDGAKGASFAWGNGNANLEIKNYRNDGQSTGPYANIDFFTGGTDADSPDFNPTRRMRIQQTGEVGIGQDDPVTTLHIGDGASHYVRIENAGSGDISSGYQIYRGSSVGMSLYDNPADNTTSLLCAGSLNINCGGSGADLHVNTNGKVGIGTTAPGHPLSVRAANAKITAESTADSQVIGFQAKYQDHATLYGSFEYHTGDAQLYIDNNFTGNGTNYSDINFRNKDTSGNFQTAIKIKGGNAGNNGYVGIGVSSPLGKLHVRDGSAQSGISHTYIYDGSAISVEATEPAIQLMAEDSGTHGGSLLWRYGNNAFSAIANPTTDTLDFTYGVTTGNDFQVHSGTNLSSYTKMMSIHNDGRDFDITSDTANDYTPRINLYSKSSGAYAGEINFYSKHNSNEWVCASIFATGAAGYGTGNPPNGGMRLYIRGAYGDTHALNAVDIASNGVVSGDFNDTSDIALKKDIVSLNASDSLTAIKALNPVSFKWKLDDEKRSGFIAQEVEEHLPNDVIGEDWRAEVKGEEGDPSKRDEGSKGKAVNSTGILAHAVKVIQEQQAAIEDLQSRIATLEG